MGKDVLKQEAGARPSAKVSVSEVAAGRVVRASSVPRLSLTRWSAPGALRRRLR